MLTTVQISSYAMGLLEEYSALTLQIHDCVNVTTADYDGAKTRALIAKRDLLCHEFIGAMEGAILSAKRAQP